MDVRKYRIGIKNYEMRHMYEIEPLACSPDLVRAPEMLHRLTLEAKRQNRSPTQSVSSVASCLQHPSPSFSD
jgi:hypothetical protein